MRRKFIAKGVTEENDIIKVKLVSKHSYRWIGDEQIGKQTGRKADRWING